MSDNREYEAEMDEKKKRTCKLFYNQGRLHHRSELLKGLSRLIEKEAIEAVYSLNKPKEWFICFNTETKAIEFSTMIITIENREYKPKLYNNQEREITIHWAPDFIPNELIAEHFNQNYTVTSINKDKDQYGFFNGNRKITLESAEINSIPHLDTIANHQILITTPGRPPLCLKCHQTGHIRQNCLTPFCRHCNIFGHNTENCIPSYATTVRQNTIVPPKQVKDHSENKEKMPEKKENKENKTNNTKRQHTNRHR